MALVTGVIAEKGRLVPFVVFSFFWSTLVYDPIAYWLWNANGWANRLGALDWAGGTPVHICSGAASLAYTLMLKRIRVERGDSPIKKRDYSGSGLESHNMTNTLLGTMLVWFGWFGFNAGSELLANVRAASTCIASNLAACSGGVAYTLLQQMVGEKWSGIGFCTGAFAGVSGNHTRGRLCKELPYLPDYFKPRILMANSIRYQLGQAWYLGLLHR
jgi:Amt family ammonium transporter